MITLAPSVSTKVSTSDLGSVSMVLAPVAVSTEVGVVTIYSYYCRLFKIIIS